MQTINFFFLEFNQPIIAKKDNFSFLQINERIPELRFKYMGSYPSDTVPQLTKYFFAIINSDPSDGRGEHWIMIARLDKSYFFADSLGRRRSTYPFLTKSIDEWFLESYKRLIISVDFTQFIQHFFLYKFFQKNLNNVYDVHVLDFISNFM